MYVEQDSGVQQVGIVLKGFQKESVEVRERERKSGKWDGDGKEVDGNGFKITMRYMSNAMMLWSASC